MAAEHASAVAVDGKGVLIRGGSGSGKSTLALGMMAHGAVLISDDQTILETRDGAIWLCAPAPIRGMIEARGVGLLRAPVAEAALFLVVDLDVTEDQRLPPRRHVQITGQTYPLVHNSITPLFPYILVHYVTYGRQE